MVNVLKMKLKRESAKEVVPRLFTVSFVLFQTFLADVFTFLGRPTGIRSDKIRQDICCNVTC